MVKGEIVYEHIYFEVVSSICIQQKLQYLYKNRT